MSTSETRVESASKSSPQQGTPQQVLSSNPIMDLAPRGPSVVQLRPVRPVFSTPGKGIIPSTVNNNGGSASLSGGGGGTPIISVNRSTPTNITLLPARPVVGGGPLAGLNLVQPNTQGQINTYQITRVRPGGVPQQPASITVTPLQASNLSANIRLAGTTMNNGTWLQTSGVSGAGFTPIRAATITVGGRPVRPADGKMIQIQQQHVAQLQMVDSKGSILKPQQLTTTPIVNIRGTLPGGANSSSSSVTLPLQPFTIRTANITNISTIQQRPPPLVSTTSPATPNICQFVNNKNVMQAMTTTPLIPKLSAVCLTLSTNANLTSNSNPPLVATRPGGGLPSTSLIMTPSSLGANTTSLPILPITKVYPIGRTDGPPVSVENLFASGPSSSGVSVSTVNISTTANTNASSSATIASSSQHHLHLVHTTPTINVHTNVVGLPQAPGGSILSGYNPTFHMNIVPHNNQQSRPISLEKKSIESKLPHGSMIIAATTLSPSLNITHLGQPPGHLTNASNSSSASTQQNHHHHPQLSSAITVTPSHVISSGGPAPLASILTMTVTTTTISSSTSTPSSSSSSSATTSTSTSSSTTTTQPAQSPNHQNSNTKATHSPRPSILRKRELGDHHHHHIQTSRAQKNLSLQLNFSSSNSTNFTSSSNKENSLSLDKFSSSTSSCGGGGGSSVSILKKEFQPPTEESSWQSVSSNSSSGSSTISTTSETAELQMQQQLSIATGVDLNLSTSLPLHSSSLEAVGPSAFVGVGLGSLSGSISGKSTSLTVGSSLALLSNTSTSSNTSQNGLLKTSQPRSRSSSTSKGNKDIDRVKNKDKDTVSPRKKPRKQQLNSSDLLEAASPEIYYQGKGKGRFRKGDLMDFSEGNLPEKERIAAEPIPEEPPPPRIVYYVKRHHMSLLATNSILPKALTTHFQRYCDVKAKEEKRPTISELANQKNILQTVSGWRVQHMTAQMEELVEGESNVINKCSAVLNSIESKIGPNSSDRDLNIVMELLKGNIQRCKVIRDQMSESKAQAEKILDHKAHVLEVINKYSTKRPLNKKRDRVF